MRTCLKQAGAASVAEAARLLRAGEVVGIPTETVYGLAANALSPNNETVKHIPHYPI